MGASAMQIEFIARKTADVTNVADAFISYLQSQSIDYICDVPL
jgi:hypothetical protein